MQTIVAVRFNRTLIDNVGIPPESQRVTEGDVHKVGSKHAAWLEERGFAERVSLFPRCQPTTHDPMLAAFLKELEGTSMQAPYENKAVVPAEAQDTKRKRGRPPGSKNKPKG